MSKDNCFHCGLDCNADGIEFDVVVNKDKQIVISHAPYMEKKYCFMPDGGRIKQEKEFNLFQMTQMEIEQFDCGSKYHPNFPEQKKLKTHKPLLQELFDKIFGADVVKSIEELKEKIKEDAEKQFQTQADQQLLNAVTEYLVENTKFSKGSVDIAKYLSKSHSKVIVGGGDTLLALKIAQLDSSNYYFVSTAGGAFLEALEDKVLPAVKALVIQ